MRIIVMLMAMALTILASDESSVKEGIESGIGKYRSDSCDNARKKVRSKYEVIKMDPGCRCFINDAHRWECDIEFTYTKEK